MNRFFRKYLYGVLGGILLYITFAVCVVWLSVVYADFIFRFCGACEHYIGDCHCSYNVIIQVFFGEGTILKDTCDAYEFMVCYYT